ncbi:MAG: hydroxymethylglutaryl-CoA reductase [Breznakibacter sp.]|nr:hydroxymethylglutaryl-CoA reductase [Breznakibacter sp.]
MEKSVIRGFHKLSREEKIDYIIHTNGLKGNIIPTLNEFLHPTQQPLINEFSENIISTYPLPFSVAPNFIIGHKHYTVPMVTEESSVVAAASKAASFWARNGGFHYRIIDIEKVGQVFFEFNGTTSQASVMFDEMKEDLKNSIADIEVRMKARGGGLTELFLIEHEPHLGKLFEIQAIFETANSMGANFINSCLERMKLVLDQKLHEQNLGSSIMAILSNYTPNCIVKCWVECQIEDLQELSAPLSANLFAKRFSQAVHIATVDKHRATTHNKGIFNGIDAVVIATGNDFRAVEAGGHAYASHKKKYQSLTTLELNDETFKYTLEIPLALGTVGGLTSTHPMAKTALEILGNPSATELMSIAASVGLANNFSAITNLITKGIQKGHMKLHLQNILNSLGANSSEKSCATEHFTDKTVSYNDVRNYLTELRKTHG